MSSRKRRRVGNTTVVKNSTRGNKRSSNGDSRGRGESKNLPSDGSSQWFWISMVTGILLVAAFWLVMDSGNSSVGSRDSANGGASSLPSKAENGGASQDVKLLLAEVSAAYRNLNVYEDQAEIVLEIRQNGQVVREAATIATAYQRPHHLRMRVARPDSELKIDFAANRERIAVEITDPTTNNFDGQFVVRAAPPKLNVLEIYAGTEYADVARPNELFSLLQSLPAQLQVSQLALLMDDDPLGMILTGSEHREVLADATLGDANCHRVRLGRNDGDFVFWIDSVSKLLRRIEYPLGPVGSSPGKLVANYRNIRVGREMSSSTFEKSVPAGKTAVRNFVLPPSDQPPAALGQGVATLVFQSLDGSPQEFGWKGRTSILCWFDRQQGSRAALAKLSEAAGQMKSLKNVDVLGVFAEPVSTVNNEQLKQMLSDWQIGVPVVRDTQAHGRDHFAIQATPTLVAVDATGTVQVVEEGVDPQLDEQLPIVVQKLVDGEQLAKGYLAFIKEKRANYGRTLAAVSADGPTQRAEVTASPVAKASQPNLLKLTSIWTANEIENAGNLLASVDAKGRVVVHVVTAQSVVGLDENGGKIRSISHGGTVQKLVSHPVHGQHVFAGWSNLGSHVVAWTPEWKRAFRYPPSDDPTARIQAVHWADLDGNDKPELYVGFDGERGVDGVNEFGQKMWSNRGVDPVVHLTSSIDESGKSFLMATATTGRVQPIDQKGLTQKAVPLKDHAFHRFQAADSRDANSSFCGLTQLPTGDLLAMGLSGNLSETWNYLLPSAAYRSQVDNVTTMRLAGAGYWLFAGSDGTVHIVSIGGKFHDSFSVGADVRGIASYENRGETFLLVSHSDQVECWQVTRP